VLVSSKTNAESWLGRTFWRTLVAKLDDANKKIIESIVNLIVILIGQSPKKTTRPVAEFLKFIKLRL
jgi:hypothetical protein